MRKITFLLMLFMATASFAQLRKVEVQKAEEIGKIQPFSQPVWIELTKRGDDYTISYKDFTYKTQDVYEKFTFKDVDNTLQTLYDMIIDGLEKLPKEAVMLEFPENYVFLHFEKSFGTPVVRFSSSQSKTSNTSLGMSNQFSKKQIEKLFGKKK